MGFSGSTFHANPWHTPANRSLSQISLAWDKLRPLCTPSCILPVHLSLQEDGSHRSPSTGSPHQLLDSKSAPRRYPEAMVEPVVLAGAERQQAPERFRIGKALVIAKVAVTLATLVSAISIALSRLSDVSVAYPKDPVPDVPTERLQPLENPGLLWARTLDSTPHEERPGRFGVPWRRRLSPPLTLSNEGGGQTGMPPAAKAVPGGVAGFPPIEKSTLLFMHVFKCAGSTLR